MPRPAYSGATWNRTVQSRTHHRRSHRTLKNAHRTTTLAAIPRRGSSVKLGHAHRRQTVPQKTNQMSDVGYLWSLHDRRRTAAHASRLSRTPVAGLQLSNRATLNAVVVTSDRGGETLPGVCKPEYQTVSWVKDRMAKGTMLHADEVSACNDLHTRHEAKCIYPSKAIRGSARAKPSLVSAHPSRFWDIGPHAASWGPFCHHLSLIVSVTQTLGCAG